MSKLFNRLTILLKFFCVTFQFYVILVAIVIYVYKEYMSTFCENTDDCNKSMMIVQIFGVQWCSSMIELLIWKFFEYACFNGLESDGFLSIEVSKGILKNSDHSLSILPFLQKLSAKRTLKSSYISCISALETFMRRIINDYDIFSILYKKTLSSLIFQKLNFWQNLLLDFSRRFIR